MRKLALRPRESCPHRGCHPVTAASLGPGWGVSRPCLCLASFPQPLKAARRAAGPQLEGGKGWTGTPPGLPQGSFLLTMLPDSSSRPLSTPLRDAPSSQRGRIWVTGATAWDPQTRDLGGVRRSWLLPRPPPGPTCLHHHEMRGPQPLLAPADPPLTPSCKHKYGACRDGLSTGQGEAPGRIFQNSGQVQGDTQPRDTTCLG